MLWRGGSQKTPLFSVNPAAGGGPVSVLSVKRPLFEAELKFCVYHPPKKFRPLETCGTIVLLFEFQKGVRKWDAVSVCSSSPHLMNSGTELITPEDSFCFSAPAAYTCVPAQQHLVCRSCAAQPDRLPTRVRYLSEGVLRDAIMQSQSAPIVTSQPAATMSSFWADACAGAQNRTLQALLLAAHSSCGATVSLI